MVWMARMGTTEAPKKLAVVERDSLSDVKKDPRFDKCTSKVATNEVVVSSDPFNAMAEYGVLQQRDEAVQNAHKGKFFLLAFSNGISMAFFDMLSRSSSVFSLLVTQVRLRFKLM